MRNRNFNLVSSVVTAALLTGKLGPFSVMAEEEQGYQVAEDDSNQYWYEDGVKQGLEGRGKEINNLGTDAWY